MNDNYLKFMRYYLFEKSSSIVITTNKMTGITFFNDALTCLIGTNKIHLGDLLNDHFVVHERDKAPYTFVEMFYFMNDQLKYTLKGYVSCVADEKLYLMDIEKHVDDSLFEQMSQINFELSNMTREINKKNKALKEKNAQITEMMLKDPLTKLHNRRFLYEQYDLIKQQYMSGEIDHIVLAIMDLDKFKHINDTYGHNTGDVVLKLFSDLIKNKTRPEDLKIRFGGDEFIVIFLNMPIEHVHERLVAIQETLRQMVIEQVEITITTSIGVVAYSSDETFEQLVKRGDEALYEAKAKGRDGIVTKL